MEQTQSQTQTQSMSVDYLRDRGLLSEDGRTVTGKEFKLVKSGVIFQQTCRNGLKYDISISWLQKAIRRGLTEQALYCAYHIFDLGKIFSSHLLNRLLTIMSEDIGVAQPGIADTIVPLYIACKNAYEDVQTPMRIIQMIVKLAASAKSRLNDWTICFLNSNPLNIDPDMDVTKLPQDMEELNYIVIQLCLNRKGVTAKLAKIWDMLEQRAGEEITSLRKAFKIRGPQYGVLHMVHAVYLAYGIKVHEGQAPAPPDTFPTWEYVSQLDFPVMEDAIDKHTSWGKKFLGRDMKDFIVSGSILYPHTPVFREQEYMMGCIPQEPELPHVHPKDHQKIIVEKSVDYYRASNDGWLIMACGTGKTFTSYWVMQEQILDGVVVFVAPILELVRQAFNSWTRLNKQYERECISAICCSTESMSEKQDKYSMNEIIHPSKINNFMRIGGRKMIFTTYKSFDKVMANLEVDPAMVVFDEAHHYKIPEERVGYKRLFLTATPPVVSPTLVIATYGIVQAVEQGMLTDYTVIRLDREEPDAPKIVDMMGANHKAIVFSASNDKSLELMEETMPMLPEEIFVGYITHKTPKKERLRIFESFRTSKRAVLFNCSILSEGVDFPECSAVFIQSGISSVRRFTQAVGRAIRLDPSNPEKIGQIYRNVSFKPKRR
jgi:hypothetical protein